MPALSVTCQLPGGLDLTQDLSLQPAFNINNQGLLRKAESIFEKEQAYLFEAGSKGPQKKQFYVNDFGCVIDCYLMSRHLTRTDS